MKIISVKVINFIYIIFKSKFSKLGYSSYGAKRYLNIIFNDLVFNKKTTVKQKYWSLKRGFPSERILRYGLNDKNYRCYISESKYYKNSSFLNYPLGNWFDNKLTTRYILQLYSAFLEKHYLFFKKGKIIRLPDCPFQITNTFESILNWLTSYGPIAAKSIKGSLGIGFYKLYYKQGKFYANNISYSYLDFINFLSRLEHYILVEYLTCHHMLKSIHDKSANALRIATLYDEGSSNIEIIGAYIRFGTEKSGFVEHQIYGAITCGVNIIDGKLYDPFLIKDRMLVKIDKHPDTQIKIEGFIPHWELICSKVKEISTYLSVTPYLTYDIIVMDESFKILEINSHGDVINMQYYYPANNNELFKKLFN